MALPTIVFDTAAGSDTQASGAGPATALFGTTDASTDGTGLVVTVTAGTDLSGVATDGSHVIFLNDATAGARNFGKITGTAGSGGATPTVTVSDAFGLTLAGKSWAIGGKRATLANTNSLKLFENNATSGDAMPGWIIETTNGQTQSFTAVVNFRRAGTTTDGPMTIRTTPGFTTRTILTWNSNTAAFFIRAGGWHFVDLQFENTNATKTAAFAFDNSGGDRALLLRLKCANSTNKFGKFINAANTNWRILYCEIGFLSLTNSISLATTAVIMGCWIHDNTGSPSISCSNGTCVILWNLFTNNTGIAIGGIPNNNSVAFIIGNTIDTQSTDGCTRTAGATATGTFVFNNIFSNLGGSAIDFGTDTVEGFSMNNVLIDCNNTYLNSGGSYIPSGAGTNDPGVNPNYINTGALNYGVGSSMAALGFPLSDLPGTTTHSYMDIGAAQRVASSGGAGGSFAFS